MKRFLIALSTLIVFLSCGCGPSFYTYKDVRYDTKEGAIKAQEEDLNRILKQIRAKKQSVYGKALLVLPSYEALRNRGFRGATREQIEHPANEEAVNYIIETSERSHLFMGDILKKSGLFEEVGIERALYPGEAAFDKRTSYDAVIYVKLEGEGRIGVYLITPKSTEEQLVFVRNAIPSNAAGYRFWLTKIDQIMEKQNALPSITNEEVIAGLEKNMNSERLISEKKAQKRSAVPEEFNTEPSLDPGKGAKYYIGFNPFMYDDMYSTVLGKGQSVSIISFTDRREGSQDGDNHIGTIYGAVYHNPLVKIRSVRSVGNAIADAVETLFMANSFEVSKYNRNATDDENERFLVRGEVNKLWVGCFHDAKATVNIGMEIYDEKKQKVIWAGRIEYEETVDPTKVFLVPFLNRTIGKAFHAAWTEKGMANVFLSVENKSRSEQVIERLNSYLANNPNDASAYLKLGITYYDVGEYDNAMKALRRSTEINTDNARAHYYLGVTQLIQGNKEAAIREYDILRNLDENFAKKLFADIYE